MGVLYSLAMKRSGTVALFPGTFDPFTNGHLDVIHRGRTLFDRLIVAIGQNPTKRPLFPVKERLEMIRQLVAESGENVEVQSYKGLTVDFARKVGATVILRGLRNGTDLNFEFQLALTNRAVADIETVFIMAGETYAFTSSSLIRQIAAEGDVDRLHRFVPPLVLERLKEKKRQLGARLLNDFPDGFKE